MFLNGGDTMNRFCANCGNEIAAGSNFCSKCGASVEGNNHQELNFKIPERNIALCLIYTIITCGIYGVYWFICITDEVNAVSKEDGTSGGMSFLFTILTCGIYGFYWAYRVGQKLGAAGKLYNKAINDNAILYLILHIFGLGLINYCLMQQDLNRFSK